MRGSSLLPRKACHPERYWALAKQVIPKDLARRVKPDPSRSTALDDMPSNAGTLVSSARIARQYKRSCPSFTPALSFHRAPRHLVRLPRTVQSDQGGGRIAAVARG